MPISRRQVLHAVGSSISVGLVGCTSDPAPADEPDELTTDDTVVTVDLDNQFTADHPHTS